MNKNEKELIEKVKQFSKMAHNGQYDIAGKDYFLHVERVAKSGKTFFEVLAGYLHDILEDTNHTEKDLIDMGVPDNVITAVKLLTKDNSFKSNPYGYYRKIKQNVLARSVKLNDLTDNLDEKRIPNPSIKDIKRREKYLEYYDFLRNN